MRRSRRWGWEHLQNKGNVESQLAEDERVGSGTVVQITLFGALHLVRGRLHLTQFRCLKERIEKGSCIIKLAGKEAW